MKRGRRQRHVSRRRVIFVGVEGKSDQAFARFLNLLCDEAGLHVHLDVRSCGGGDSVAVVEETARQLRRHPDPRGISTRLVLLDMDRMGQDRAEGRDALALAAKHGLQTIVIDPNLEGLLVGIGARHMKPPPQIADRSVRAE